MPRSRMRLDLQRFTRQRLAGVIIVSVALIAALITYASIASCRDTAVMYKAGFHELGAHEITNVKQFDTLLRESRYLAVMFESRICPHCRMMKPYWEVLEENQDKLGFAVYHVTFEPGTQELFMRYGIEETPTFIVFVDGKPVAKHVGVFDGGNVTEAMLEWVRAAIKAAEEGNESGVEVERGTGVTSLSRELAMGFAALAAAIAAAAAAGVTTSFSPCVLPVLLVYLSTLASQGRRLGLGECAACGLVAALGSLGIAAAFALAGSLAASLQSLLTIAMSFAVIAAGAASLLGVPMEIGTMRVRRAGLLSFCAAYGILALQCTLPMVLGALLLAASLGSLVNGLLVAAVFAGVMGGTLTLASYAASRLGSSFVDKLLARSQLLNRLGGLTMLAAGLILLAYNLGLVIF